MRSNGNVIHCRKGWEEKGGGRGGGEEGRRRGGGRGEGGEEGRRRVDCRYTELVATVANMIYWTDKFACTIAH